MLQSQRIQFKPLSITYKKPLEDLFCKNPLVMQNTLKGRVLTANELQKIVEDDFITSTDETVGFWCLTNKEDNTFIGVSGLLKCDYLGKESYEFGFILDDNFWGKGIATEIGEFWIDYAKNQLKLDEILATASPENHASRRVLEKLNLHMVRQFTSKERGARLLYSKKL
ncbi:GNAT family N-acetyltransferase [Cellulophaga fucicola]|uniref:Acetyltransferase (GNAT) domain-containing protein n=1 Tax=Cellulophaga fucicola TaxID=76595 RepID=A0A1K1QC12_9FLAO|nr:GNAT family N-acetyltransferase [Cellulophaga fucicola]SFW57472.1 Acetyltransferase (GNAT) domain-containing protein [Cellulophaga fucicola]